MIPFYLRPSLRVLICSLLTAIVLDHFTTSLNPFQCLVVLVLMFSAIMVQLVLLRRKGLMYVGTFLLWLIVLTSLFSYIDNQTFNRNPKRRYYAIH